MATCCCRGNGIHPIDTDILESTCSKYNISTEIEPYQWKYLVPPIIFPVLLAYHAVPYTQACKSHHVAGSDLPSTIIVSQESCMAFVLVVANPGSSCALI